MSATNSRERLEITVDPAEKRALMRWARRMNVSVGALLEYCFVEQAPIIREELAKIELEIRARDPDMTEGYVSDLAFEEFGENFIRSGDPAQ